MFVKASSTFVASRAEVSMKDKLCRSANSFAWSVDTDRMLTISLLLPTIYNESDTIFGGKDYHDDDILVWVVQ